MSLTQNKINVSTFFLYLKELLVFIFLVPTISCFCQETEDLILTPDQSVLSSGMQAWLNLISNEQLTDYGFNNREEFTRIKIGNPLYIYIHCLKIPW
jgi:hypothetical protein